MQLSPHISLDEMTHTDLRQFQEENRLAVNGRALTAMMSLCSSILEPIRAHFSAPIFIYSGFRFPALNAAVGSTRPNSQHTKGEAADFHIAGVPLDDIFNWIRLHPSLPFGQVILEGSPPSWIHVSLGAPFRDASKCGQALIAKKHPNGLWTYEAVK